jgi:7-cyano-7-deazaguanine synthase
MGRGSGMKAIVLMSGGLDSTTVLAYAISKGYEITGLSFDYGQRHKIELESSKKIAEFYGINRNVFKIDLRQIGGSSLTDKIEIEKGKIGREEVPNTYVPARNIIFLSIAGGYADVAHIDDIMIGVNAVDYSGYPDCRPDFISSMERTLRLGLSGSHNIQIIAPLQHMSKSEIIKMGMNLKAPYELTHSCYRGGTKACGKCDSCLLRLKGFMEAGYFDPIEYEEYPEFYNKYLQTKK